MTRFILCLLLAAASPVVAQPSGWSVGAGAVVSDSPFAGEGKRVIAIPLLGYQGERVYLRGVTAGVVLWRAESLSLDASLGARLDGIDADDFGRAELARNGVDRDLLDDRDHGIDAGLTARWRGTAGELTLGVRQDVSGTSEGQEWQLDYGYPVPLGRGLLTMELGVKRLDADLADYYYGISDDEVARGIAAYRPGAVTLPNVGVSLRYPFADRWSLLLGARYERLPDALTDSPLLERDRSGTASLLLGVTRAF